MKQTLFLLLTLVTSTLYADLTVSVKEAAAVITTAGKTITQVQIDDGVPIGEAIETDLPIVVSNKQPVAVMMLKTSVSLDILKVKTSCSTATVKKLLPGVYCVDSPGTHVVKFDTLSIEPFSWDDTTVTVTVGASPGPTPGPGPQPPLPPGPNVAPIDGSGYRVLFVVESGVALTSSQREILYGADVRAFLNTTCINVEGTPDWRLLDPDTKFTDPSHRFSKALARPRASLPWIIISNGATGYEGPLPADKAAALSLLRQYAPNAAIKRPVLTMVTLPNCTFCDQFKRVELPFLSGVDFVEQTEMTYNHTYSQYPHFILRYNGLRSEFSGYTTSAQIQQQLSIHEVK